MHTPKGDVIVAQVENTIRRWASQHKKISWVALSRKSHIRERYGIEICRKAAFNLEGYGDIQIVKDPEQKATENRWLIIWRGLSGIAATPNRGGIRPGAGRKKKAVG